MALRGPGGKDDCADDCTGRPASAKPGETGRGATVANLSISKAWDETRGLLSRNSKLLMTVAAAMFLLPQVIVGVVVGAGADAVQGTTAGALMVVAALVGLVGQLAIAWLAIGTGVSVGEAIRHGMRRALPFLGAILMLVIAFVLIFVVAAAILMATGTIDGAAAAVKPSPRDLLVILLVMFVPFLFLSMRLLPSNAVAAAENHGPVGILKRSWDLTRGHAGRLFGFMAIFLIGVLIAAVAIGVISGLLANILFGGTEPFSAGALALALVNGLVQAAVMLVYVVMVARIYVQLAGDRSAETSVPTSGT